MGTHTHTHTHTHQYTGATRAVHGHTPVGFMHELEYGSHLQFAADCVQLYSYRNSVHGAVVPAATHSRLSGSYEQRVPCSNACGCGGERHVCYGRLSWAVRFCEGGVGVGVCALFA